MARDFISANSESFKFSTALVAVVPCTISIWFSSEVAQDNQTLWAQGDEAGGSGYWQLRVDKQGTKNKLMLTAHDGTSESTITGGTQISLFTHCHAVAVFRSITDRELYLDGVSEGTSVVSRNSGSFDNTTLGALDFNSLVADFMKGKLGHCSMWDVGLINDEILSLANGYSPLHIRRDNLKAYIPGNRLSGDEINVIGGDVFTEINTPGTGVDRFNIYRTTVAP